MKKDTTTTYNQVVTVVSEYLGPATERFVERLIDSHIGKRPDELTEEDIAVIHDWGKLTIAFLSDDPDTVAEFSNKFMTIYNNQQKTE